jgi:hypothetical protein
MQFSDRFSSTIFDWFLHVSRMVILRGEPRVLVPPMIFPPKKIVFLGKLLIQDVFDSRVLEPLM